MLDFEQMLFNEQKELRCLVRQESGGPPNFEPIFVDSQSLDFCVKGWSWNPQFACRTTWTGDAAPAFCEGALNHLPFLPMQRFI
jgi:hypothetical protein